MNNQPLQMEERKMDFSKEDLIRLLSLLKSELQTKEIALASMKSEQLKRLINPIEISRSSLASAYVELQDKFKLLDQNNNAKKKEITDSQSNRNTHQHKLTGESGLLDKKDYFPKEDNDRECLNILSTLLELLDRHPLLALPRDTIYCLDYNCNELSTKNYLNIKIQQLDNLINQHRRFRYYMNEHLRRSEQRCLELSRDLELERSMKNQNEKSFYNLSGKSVLLKHINQLKETLEMEKRNKQEIVMTLLNELLDERERCESLSRKIAEYKLTSSDSVEKISREKEKLLMLESDLNNLASQMRKQTSTLTKERNDMFSRVGELEQENAVLRAKIEDQNRRLDQHQNSISNETNNQQSPSKSHITIKQVNSTAPINRNTPNAAISKSSATSKVTPTPSSPNTSNRNYLGKGLSSSTKDSQSSEQSTPKVSLLKTSSASFSGQSSRNTKISNMSSSGSVGNNSRTPTTLSKPQVPAKPAQLLDQRNSRA